MTNTRSPSDLRAVPPGRFDAGPVRIGWAFAADDLACNVDVFWQGQLIARKRLVSDDPMLVFDVCTESSPFERVDGELRFDVSGGALFLDQLQFPDGSVSAMLLGEARPAAPLPEGLEEDLGETVVEEAGGGFPYTELPEVPEASEPAEEVKQALPPSGISGLQDFDALRGIGGESTIPSPPIGSVCLYLGEVAQVPSLLEAQGWMVCDGRQLPITVYPQLYAALGFLYGGDFGSGVFGLPDLRGAFVPGVDKVAAQYIIRFR